MGRITDPITKFLQAYKDGLILACPPQRDQDEADELAWTEHPAVEEKPQDRPFIPFN